MANDKKSLLTERIIGASISIQPPNRVIASMEQDLVIRLKQHDARTGYAGCSAYSEGRVEDTHANKTRRRRLRFECFEDRVLLAATPVSDLLELAEVDLGTVPADVVISNHEDASNTSLNNTAAANNVGNQLGSVVTSEAVADAMQVRQPGEGGFERLGLVDDSAGSLDNLDPGSLSLSGQLRVSGSEFQSDDQLPSDYFTAGDADSAQVAHEFDDKASNPAIRLQPVESCGRRLPGIFATIGQNGVGGSRFGSDMVR